MVSFCCFLLFLYDKLSVVKAGVTVRSSFVHRSFGRRLPLYAAFPRRGGYGFIKMFKNCANGYAALYLFLECRSYEKTPITSPQKHLYRRRTTFCPIFVSIPNFSSPVHRPFIARSSPVHYVGDKMPDSYLLSVICYLLAGGGVEAVIVPDNEMAIIIDN